MLQKTFDYSEVTLVIYGSDKTLKIQYVQSQLAIFPILLYLNFISLPYVDTVNLAIVIKVNNT